MGKRGAQLSLCPPHPSSLLREGKRQRCTSGTISAQACASLVAPPANLREDSRSDPASVILSPRPPINSEPPLAVRTLMVVRVDWKITVSKQVRHGTLAKTLAPGPLSWGWPSIPSGGRTLTHPGWAGAPSRIRQKNKKVEDPPQDFVDAGASGHTRSATLHYSSGWFPSLGTI